MKNIVIIITCFCMIRLTCCGQKSNQDKNVTQTVVDNRNDKVLIHTFRDKNGIVLGNAYVKYIVNNKEVFNSFVITNKNYKETDTIYKINLNKFILVNKNKIDLEVLQNGFYGYKVVLKKNDYIVLSYLRNKGKNVSDDITIEWNYNEKQFEVMKTP